MADIGLRGDLVKRRRGVVGEEVGGGGIEQALRLRALVALAEPLLLMLMAGIVGTIVIGSGSSMASTSAITSSTVGSSSGAGREPAERTWMRPWAWCSISAAAIWERPALPWHTNSTRGFRDSSVPATIAFARRRANSSSLIVPAAFSLAIGAERRIGPWLGRRLLTYRPGDADEGAAIEHQPPAGAIGGPAGRIGYHGDGGHPAE